MAGIVQCNARTSGRKDLLSLETTDMQSKGLKALAPPRTVLQAGLSRGAAKCMDCMFATLKSQVLPAHALGGSWEEDLQEASQGPSLHSFLSCRDSLGPSQGASRQDARARPLGAGLCPATAPSVRCGGWLPQARACANGRRVPNGRPGCTRGLAWRPPESVRQTWR